jgi:Sigma-70, region 4
MIDAVRWPVLHDDSTAPSARQFAGQSAAPGVWRSPPDQLTLVTDSSELPALMAEAACWAERITACVSAPDSERGSGSWWRELLARSSKCEGVFVRRPEQAEAWLLGRLHATGNLRLVEAGGKQVASNLIVFARGTELRVLLSHIPLERALAGAPFGALLCFQGSQGSELARACRAQLTSWAELARIPTGSQLDALTLDPRRRGPALDFDVPRTLRVLTEPTELAAGLADWARAADGASVRAFSGGYRVSLEAGSAAHALTLNLHAGPAWAAGNALLLEADGRTLLVWRGGLLGHSRARSELFWSEVRSPSFLLENAALGLSQRVAVVAQTGAPLAPQLAAFASEQSRLGDVFGVEPPPALGHVLADFATLSSKQQTRLVWRSLIGLGALALEAAAHMAAESLRDQGYLRGEALEPGSAPLLALAQLLAGAADAGRSFDSPSEGRVRAIQPELAAYVAEDWLACLLAALPEGEVIAHQRALRLGFERARDVWGLWGERLARGGRVEHALEGCVSYALSKGLLVRVGAAGLKRPGRAGADLAAAAAPPNESLHGFVAGWTRALESLTPVQRYLVTRRSGWYGRRESLESVAQRLGITLERARQVEADAWRLIEAGSSWAHTLRARLERALAGARSVPVRRLVLDDAWWRGAEQHLELCEAVFESLLGAELCLVELGAPGQREALFARYNRGPLESSLQALLEQAAALPTPAPLADYAALCAKVAAELDADLLEPLRETLEPCLELDPDDATRVLRFVPVPRSLESLPIETREVDSEALLRLEDVLRSVFRTAGTPLSLSAAAERVRKRLDVSEALIAERLTSAPFVHRNPDQYGLVTRDVPGGAEAIASVLDALAESLASRQRALGASAAAELAETQVKRAWSPELLHSLIAGDPALYLSGSHDTTLRRWQHARLVPHGAPICPGVPPSARPRFEKLAQQPPPATEALRRQLAAELGRLERSADPDDLVALPLARQLCDLAERLLEHATGAPAEPQQLTHAATQCLLDALAPDEDEPDAPALDADALVTARAVMAAVLRWLELDWLAGAPPAART